MASETEEPISAEKEIQILHLEDDAIDTELVHEILESAGISSRITRVQAANEFSGALSESQYKLILADYRLPAYDGVSALHFSRENYPDTPFIFVSGTLGEDAAIEGLTHGATDYVLKSKLARLVPAVKRALNEAENRRKRKEAEETLGKTNVLLERIFSTTEFMLVYLDADYNFIRVNRAFAEASEEKDPDFFEGKNYFELYPDPENEAVFHRVVETNEPYVAYAKPFVYARHPERGTTYWNWSLQPVKDEDGRVNGLVLSLIDVTEREQAYITLRQREEQLRLQGAALEAAANGFIITDRDGKILWVNPAFTRLTGYSMQQVAGRKPSILKSGKQDLNFYKNLWDTILSGQVWYGELVNRHQDGHFYTEEMTIAPLRAEGGEISHFIAVKQDITERKQAEAEHQAHLRFLESMDKVNRAMQGTNDLEQMMGNVLDIVLSIFECDRAFLLYPCDPNASSWSSPMERTRPEYPGVLALGMDEVPMDTDVARTLRVLLENDGPVKFGPKTPNPLPVDVAERFAIKSFMSMALYPKMDKPWQFGIHQCSYARVWTSEDERLFQEIGRRLSDALFSLLAYRNLQESEERYRLLGDASPDAIMVYGQGRIVFVNPAAVRLAGAKSVEDLVGRSVLEFLPPDYSENVNKEIEHILRTGKSGFFVRENILRADGTKFDAEVAIVPYQLQGEGYIQILGRDITERKQHEREREAIVTVSTALRKATTKTEILSVILSQLAELFDADGTMISLRNPETGDIIVEMGRGAVGERFAGLVIPQDKGVSGWVINNKRPYLNNHADADPVFYRADLLGDSPCVASVPLIAQEQAIGALWIARRTNILEQELRTINAIADIAANAIHRVMLHEQTEQQLHHLIALHQIDLAISANFDLNVTLSVILKNVRDELEVDAASILLLDAVTHTLDYVAGVGFRTRRIEQSHVKLGYGCAGCAAQEYRTVPYPDLRQASDTFSRSVLLADEEFLSHYATPMIVKGKVKGVLEIFHRKVFTSEQEWTDYFETLATQAAIAIENASLFENLQRSNKELTLAYDATIEGWSRALDLRDKETEGHTQRVTEMLLELAEKMGMRDEEKITLRRGALLHDIGKMGVPDTILLKTGPLSDSDWEIMRRHPTYAYQMLSPISYLKYSLDIPYCHHEKWDGTGYPRGLKGEAIPLFARMFAVVDVFDALTSDRHYRDAWNRDRALKYIQEQAGKYFDPQIVKLFIETNP